MKIKRCENGHYYDGDKHNKCPFCLSDDELAAVPEKYRKLGNIVRLDRGSTCKVYKINSDFSLALKVINCGSDKKKYENALNEKYIRDTIGQSDRVISILDFDVVDSGDGEKTVYILEKYYNSLEQFASSNDCRPKEILKIAIDICDAVAEVIDRGVYHLDLNPQNIFLSDENKIILGNFGSALAVDDLAKNQSVRGTLEYMAPEVYREHHCSEQSEIYSIGLILYYLLNERRLPFVEDIDDTKQRELAVYKRLAGAELPLLSFSEPFFENEINSLIKDACAYKSESRTKSISDLKNRLCIILAESEGQLEDAREYYEKLLEISLKLAEETKTVDSRRDLSICYERLGDIAKAEGRLEDARGYYEKLLEISLKLAEETQTEGSRRDLSICYERLGDIAQAEGRLEDLCEYYEKSIEILPIESSASDDFDSSADSMIVSANEHDDGDGVDQDDGQTHHRVMEGTVQGLVMGQVMPIFPFRHGIVAKRRRRTADGVQIRCRFCGKEISPGASFCRRCGSKVGTEASAGLPPQAEFSAIPPKQAEFSAAPGKAATEKPTVRMSSVEFSAIAPKHLVKGEYSIIDIVMYEDSFRHIVDEIRSQSETETQEKKSGKINVQSEANIKVALNSNDIEIEDNEMTGVWQGSYLDFSFPIFLPEDYSKKQVLFIAKVFINDVIATRLTFAARCSSLFEQKIRITRKDVLTAFISYASQDRKKVAAIVQGMQKARPDMDLFFDVESLRSGENWEKALFHEIEKRDILYLCWSHFAKNSEWVDKEWRYAYAQKGIDGIEPIPIELPEVCPPPRELSGKHWNDRLLYLIDHSIKNSSEDDPTSSGSEW